MASYRATAAAVAEQKRRHPEKFCPVDQCLWRTGGGRCPRHPASLAVELAEMEARDPKLKALGERIESFGRAIAERQQVDAAVSVVADAIRVLRTRDGVALTDEQCEERARNAVTALVAEGLAK